MNSKSASFFNSERKTIAGPGNVIDHICMKIKNWSKFIRFQRYLSPKYKTSYKKSMLSETAAMAEAMSSLISSIFKSSSSLLYRMIGEAMIRLSSSYKKSSLSMKIPGFLNLRNMSSGSFTLFVILSGN